MTAGKRVLLLSQWFEPESVPKGLKLAKGLADRGYEVEVATGLPNYPSGKLAPGYRLRPYQLEIMNGILVHRLFLYPSHSQSSVGRAVNYLSFFLSAFLFCLVKARRFDVIYVYHPPITVGLAAALSGIVTRTRFVLDVQDLWPDSVTVSGMAGTKLLARCLNLACDFVYRRAALVIGQSDAMTNRLVQRGVPQHKTATIFNWADEDAARRGEGCDVGLPDFEGYFNFVFGGNLGAVQGLETLVLAASKAAIVVPDIQLTLIGNGVDRDRLAALIAKPCITNVRLEPAVPPTQIGNVFAGADVLVLHLVDHPLFEVTIPSKTQFYMAMGKPILVGMRGEAANIVLNAAAGLQVQPEDVDAMAAAMIVMARLPASDLANMGRNARSSYEANYSFSAGLDATSKSLSALLRSTDLKEAA